MATVVLTTSKVDRQLAKMGRSDPAARRALTNDLMALEQEPPPGNINIKPRQGQPPWFRLRQGDWRAALFPLDRQILQNAGYDADRGYLCWLVANKSAFETAARRLPKTVAVPPAKAGKKS